VIERARQRRNFGRRAIVVGGLSAAVSLVVSRARFRANAAESKSHSVGRELSNTRMVSTRGPTEELPDGTRDPVFFPFASDSPWNTPIGSNAEFADNGDITTQHFIKIATNVNRLRWSVGIGIATIDDPYTEVTFLDFSSKIPQPANNPPEPLRIPPDAMLTGGSDGWFAAIQPDRRTAWDFYALTRESNGYTTRYWKKIDLCGSGINGGTRASKMALLGGLIRQADIDRGAIDHALAMSIWYTQLKQGYVWPASSEDGASEEYSGSIPMGSLFAIPGTIDVNFLGLSRFGLMLARCLQNYGAYVAMSGAAVAIVLEMSVAEEVQNSLKADWRVLRGLMRRVTNNNVTSVGGGGDPRVPLLADPVCNVKLI